MLGKRTKHIGSVWTVLLLGLVYILYMERQKQMKTKASFAFAAAAKNITLRAYVELWTGGLLRQWYQEINVFT